MKNFNNWQELRALLDSPMPPEYIQPKGEHPFIPWEGLRDLLDRCFDADGWDCVPIPGSVHITAQEDMNNDRGQISRHASATAACTLVVRCNVNGEPVELRRSATGSATAAAKMNRPSDGRGSEAWNLCDKMAERSAMKRAAATLARHFDPAGPARPAQSQPAQTGQAGQTGQSAQSGTRPGGKNQDWGDNPFDL